MKLLVDMNLSPDWIPYLADRGFESVHWSNVGAPDAFDATIFEYARAAGAIVFTHDLDFTTMLALSRFHGPSLVQARVQDISPELLGPSVVAALRQFSVELERGAIVTILPERSKVRVLPI
jgi:predicted nuclease of predicted toxin-antitoxin system